MHESQYPIVAARRQGYDNLLWQVPALGVAAQSFPVSAAVGKDSSPALSAGLLLAASIVGAAIAWLFRKLRMNEVADSELLKTYEEAGAAEKFLVVHGRRMPGLGAYLVWQILLIASVALEGFGAIVMACRI